MSNFGMALDAYCCINTVGSGGDSHIKGGGAA